MPNSVHLLAIKYLLPKEFFVKSKKHMHVFDFLILTFFHIDIAK